MNDLFETSPLDDLNIDGMQLVDINIDDINEEAKSDAVELIDNLSKFYYDVDFMRRHPNFKKRVDSDLESLRILFKMRKTDEVAHDLLIKAISGNSGNASLYKSLSETQKTIISITSKINDIVEGLNNMMKGYQLEINFDHPENQEVEEEHVMDNKTFRGSKDFISMMNNTQNLFTEEEEAE